jgi:hypothetical protein
MNIASEQERDHYGAPLRQVVKGPRPSGLARFRDPEAVKLRLRSL